MLKCINYTTYLHCPTFCINLTSVSKLSALMNIFAAYHCDSLATKNTLCIRSNLLSLSIIFVGDNILHNILSLNADNIFRKVIWVCILNLHFSVSKIYYNCFGARSYLIQDISSFLRKINL